MTQVNKVNDGKNNFELHIPDELKTLFADGSSGAMVGFPNSKLMFHSTRLPSENGAPEIRTAVFELVIPTNVLVEFCRNILSSMVENKAAILSGGNVVLAQVNQMLEEVDIKPITLEGQNYPH